MKLTYLSKLGSFLSGNFFIRFSCSTWMVPSLASSRRCRILKQPASNCISAWAQRSWWHLCVLTLSGASRRLAESFWSIVAGQILLRAHCSAALQLTVLQTSCQTLLPDWASQGSLKYLKQVKWSQIVSYTNIKIRSGGFSTSPSWWHITCCLSSSYCRGKKGEHGA